MRIVQSSFEIVSTSIIPRSPIKFGGFEKISTHNLSHTLIHKHKHKQTNKQTNKSHTLKRILLQMNLIPPASPPTPSGLIVFFLRRYSETKI
jgi:hypothetical protein